jgi:hypothetical protein
MDLPYRQRSLEEVKAHRDALSALADDFEEGHLSAPHAAGIIDALHAAADCFDMLVEQVENQVIIF